MSLVLMGKGEKTMHDLEKVINGLRHCLHYTGSCLDCPYNEPNCQNDVLDDAIALLKEQKKRIETLESLRRIEQEGR